MNCGVPEDEYVTIKDDAFQSNYEMWTRVHGLLTLVFAIYTVVTLITGEQSSNDYVYPIVAMYCLVVFGVFHFVLNSGSYVSQGMIYLTITVLFLCGISTSLVSNDTKSVLFQVLLIGAPLFIIDRPIHITTIILAADIVYIPHVIAFKDSSVWADEFVNTFVFSLAGIISNITYNRMRVHELLLKRALAEQRDTDMLTGLQNKFSMTRDINQFVRSTKDGGVFLMMDIDHFKGINDHYGHDIGDDVLRKLGTYMKENIDKKHVVGRFGGDEFIIFLRDGYSIEQAEEIAKQILEYVNNEVHTPLNGEVVGMSIGIAERNERDHHYDSIFRRADKALYRAKNDGRNCYRIYDEDNK